MAMDKDRLGGAIWTAVKALYDYEGDLSGAMDTAGLALWTTIADKIILEIQGHAVVTSVGIDPPGDGSNVNSTGTVA